MQRRRFFPARPVQQVPGRSVELAVQVRKDGAAPAPAPAPAPVAGGAVSWVAPSPLIPEWATTTPTAMDGEPGRWMVSLADMVDLLFEGEVLPWPTVEFPEVDPGVGYRGEPWWGEYGQQLPPTIPSGSWRCTRISYGASRHNEYGYMYYAGAYFGPGAERVQWELAWSSPGTVPGSSSDGSMAVPYGAAIYVYPVLHSLQSSIAPSTLVATAMLDGVPVGTLEFELRGPREAEG